MLELSDVRARTLGSAPAREQGGVGTEPVVRIRTPSSPPLEAFACSFQKKRSFCLVDPVVDPGAAAPPQGGQQSTLLAVGTELQQYRIITGGKAAMEDLFSPIHPSVARRPIA